MQTGDLRAFFWQNGTMHALSDLVASELHLTINTAHGINNAGQIAADGYIIDGPYVALRLNPVPPLPADLTCDWHVNASDLLELIRNWGVCDQPTDPLQLPPFAPDPCPADINNDNRVGVPDLLYVINHWQP